MRAEDPEITDVPEASPAEFAAWLLARAEPVMIASEAHLLNPLPDLDGLLDLLYRCVDSGREWLLADGPRERRPSWALDPWWSERPEMTAEMIAATRSCCVALPDLIAALEQG